MRRFAALVLIVCACVLPAGVCAAKSKSAVRPLVAVFGSVVGVEGAPVSLEMTAAVIDQLTATGQVDMITFNPSLPNIARAVLENRLPKAVVDDPWNPKNAAKIAQIMNAQYALCMKGATDDAAATIELDMVKVPSGGDWTVKAESQIAPGPRTGTVRSNAVATAASSAVSQLMIEAFGDKQGLLPVKPKVETPPPVTVKPTVEPPAPTPPPVVAVEPPAEKPVETPPVVQPTPAPVEPVRDVVAEYNAAIRQADIYLTKKDMRNAALELRHAVNLDPLTPSARIKLAGVYADLGMTPEAIDECERALLFSADNISVLNTLVKLYISDGKLDDAAAKCREVMRIEPNNVDARISLGDILWNQSKVDEAAVAYGDVLKVDPANVTAHTRLQKLYAARKMYDQAIKHLVAIKVPSPTVEPDASKRYVALAGVIMDEFGTAFDKVQSSRRDFDRGSLIREDYYRDSKDTVARVDGLASYLTTQTPPTAYREANSHGVLAVSLLSQAAGCIVSYLETEKLYYKEQAQLLLDESKSEIDLFSAAVARNG